MTLLKSSSVYTAVHPVPDPTAQNGFSSDPLCTIGHKPQIQNESCTLSVHNDTESTDHNSSVHADPSAAISSACVDENSTLFDTNGGKGLNSSSSHPSSLPNKENYEMNRDEPGRVHSATKETFDEKKFAENDQVKVTIS